MSEKEINVGIVGAGDIAQRRHLPNLQKIEGVNVVAVCNRTRETVAKVAEDFQIPGVYTNWRELMRQEEIDAVFIATPPYLHCPATLAALETEKHVFCQARMAMNYPEAKKMYEASQQSDLKTMLCPVPAGLRSGTINGSNGTLVYNLDTDEIYGAQIGEDDLNPLAIPEELQDGRTAEEDFIAAIRYNTPVSPSFFAGLKYMEFTEAVMRSVHEKCAVNLPLN